MHVLYHPWILFCHCTPPQKTTSFLSPKPVVCFFNLWNTESVVLFFSTKPTPLSILSLYDHELYVFSPRSCWTTLSKALHPQLLDTSISSQEILILHPPLDWPPNFTFTKQTNFLLHNNHLFYFSFTLSFLIHQLLKLLSQSISISVPNHPNDLHSLSIFLSLSLCLLSSWINHFSIPPHFPAYHGSHCIPFV